MSRQIAALRPSILSAACVVVASLVSTTASAAPYRSVGVSSVVPGSGVTRSFPGSPTSPYAAIRVWGKESVNDWNVDSAATASRQGEQIQQWDGWGAVVDGQNFTGTRQTAARPDDEIDALAATRDALFDAVLQDRTSLVFSIDDESYGFSALGAWVRNRWVPSSGALTTASGLTLAGAGEITRVVPGSLATNRWSIRPAIDGRTYGTASSEDISGLEFWGEEFDHDPMSHGDTGKYSLRDDASQMDPQGTWSIWNADGTGYLSHATVVAAVTSLLGPAPTNPNGNAGDLIDIDALMVRDGSGNPNLFDLCSDPINCTFAPSRGVDQEGVPLVDGLYGPTIPDTVIFSIRQIADGTGYYATGSELFVINQYGGASFLTQGGHAWDKNFALNNLSLVGVNIGSGDLGIEHTVVDINALEAIGDIVDTIPLPGDLNRDGAVNAGDYTFWRDGLDLGLDLDDYETWSSNYGGLSGIVTTGGGGPIGVPEPTAATLAALGAVVIRAIKRTR